MYYLAYYRNGKMKRYEIAELMFTPCYGFVQGLFAKKRILTNAL